MASWDPRKNVCTAQVCSLHVISMGKSWAYISHFCLMSFPLIIKKMFYLLEGLVISHIKLASTIYFEKNFVLHPSSCINERIGGISDQPLYSRFPGVFLDGISVIIYQWISPYSFSLIPFLSSSSQLFS